jgi:hypothetical protein
LFSASGTIETSAALAGNPDSFAFAAGTSMFDIEFDLPMPHRFTLSGLLAVEPRESISGFAEADLGLISGSSGLIAFQFGRRFGSQQLDATGVLPAGTYRLSAEAFSEALGGEGFARNASSFDFDFALTPTPEPGALLLFGGGLLALVSKRLTARARSRSVHSGCPDPGVPS